MTLQDQAICAARSAWYGLTEPARLRLCRLAWNLDRRSDDPPFVSVYIPTFNRASILMARAIPSVLRQTWPRFELIVACHGCTDGTADTVRRLDDPRIRVLEVPRQQTYPPTALNHWLAGPIVPANAALRECRGNWIARLDDDDVWLPHHLDELIGFALAHDYEFVSSAHDGPSGKVKPYRVHGMNIGGVQTWVYRSYLRFMRFNPDCWRKAWNRNNDVDLQNRFVSAGVRMGYLDRVTCLVVPRPGENEIGSRAYLAEPERTERTFAFKSTNA